MVKVLGNQELPDAVEGVRTEVGNGDKGLMDPLSSEGLTGIKRTENWGVYTGAEGGLWERTVNVEKGGGACGGSLVGLGEPGGGWSGMGGGEAGPGEHLRGLWRA